jgi:2,4-dienoyl-CoA reductase-like NADH-dependent reductase (Old Yellow Enzyme family)
MSILFEPLSLGNVPIRNRFVHSATYEGLAAEGGEVTDALVNRYRRLARGEVGLVIPGGLHVHPLGRSSWPQAGIDRDDLIPGLRQIVDAVHQEGGEIVFQLLSPFYNERRDAWGGSEENRFRFL